MADDSCINPRCDTAPGQSCPACRQLVPPGNKFCGQCGVALAPEHAARPGVAQAGVHPSPAGHGMTAGELFSARRDVSVVFLDITNFTAASHSLDSEEVFVWMQETLGLLATVVHKYEGTIDKFTGDGLMALFGAPVAHENDPELAIRAALEMQTIIRPLRNRIKQKHGFDFQMRIGINTGPVIAGNVGDGAHVEYTVLGDTVNLASRLEKAADPGTVLVSAVTYQRTQPLFEYTSLPPLSVKGVDEPLQTFRPLEPLARPGSLRGLSGVQSPMIGRAHLLTQLQEALEQVRTQRHHQIALITGEAGLGKSRLIAEFRKTCQRSDLRFYQGGCLAGARSTPLWVIATLLRDILHLSEIDPPAIQRETLRAYLNEIGVADLDVLPYLSTVLGLEQTDPEIAARLQRMDSSMLQRQTHAALRQLFLAEAAHVPTILVFDDLHWVDPASRDFLEYLIQTTDDAALMLVLLSRDSERQTVIRSLIAVAEKTPDQLTDLQLQALSEVESALLIDQLIPQNTEAARALKQQIAQRAAGNPFYLEEIIRILIDHGGLIDLDGVWQVTLHSADLLREVPGTLKGLILARFDGLPQELRRMLQKAAVLGRSFPASLLQILEGTGSAAITEQFSELESRQFLVAEPFGWAQGYAFRHVLIQEAIYGTLLKRDRQIWHEHVAQLVERAAFWPKEEQIEVLGYHYAESATPRKAVPYLIDAAENAARRYANETAIRHYRRALALMSPVATAAGADFSRARAGLGQALKYVGQFAEAGQILVEALAPIQVQPDMPHTQIELFVTIVRELADVRQRERAYDTAIAHLEVGIAALGAACERTEPVMWRALMDRLAWVRFRQGRLDEALALASTATQGVRLDYADDPITLASLFNTLGGVHWQRGDFAAAIDYVERSLRLFRELNYAWGTAIAHTNLGILYYACGHWPKAEESFDQAAILRRDNGYLPEQAVNLQNLGTLRMEMGDHARARRDLESSLAISQRLEDRYGVVGAQIGLLKLAVIQGDFAAAERYAENAPQQLDAAGPEEAIQLRWLLALVYDARGETKRGQECAAQALHMARAAEHSELESECLRVLGTLHARGDDSQAAEALFHESIAACRQRNDAYREGLALIELGRLYEHLPALNAPDRTITQALEAYGNAADLFRQLGAAYDLDAARAAHKRLANITNARKEATYRPSHSSISLVAPTEAERVMLMS